MLFAKDEAVASDISRNEIRVKKLNSYSKFVVALSLIVVLTNAAQALISNGIPPFSGKGDPERVSLNNTWTAGVWKKLTKPMSFRGSNVVEKPFIAGENNEIGLKFDSNSQNGAFVSLKPALEIKNTTELDFSINGIFGKGVASGFAYDAKNDIFGISNTEGGVYFTDSNFKEIAHAVINLMAEISKKPSLLLLSAICS